MIDELSPIGVMPKISKDGSVTYPTADEMIHSIDAAVEQGLRTGDGDALIATQLNMTKKRLDTVYQTVQGKLKILIDQKVPMEDPRRRSLSTVLNDTAKASTHIDKKLKDIGVKMQSKSDDQKSREEATVKRLKAAQTPSKGANSL